MNKLQKKLLDRFNISTGITMRFRLFLFLLLLVLTMAGGIIIIMLVTGIFTAGIAESQQVIQNELEHTSEDISTQYGQLSIQAVDYSKELSKSIEDYLQKQNLALSGLSEEPKQLEELTTQLYEDTYYYLQKSGSSGAFFILDTTVNPALDHSENSKAGLYVKNLEPNILSASSPNFTLLRGFSSIGRNNSINLHTQWSLEFDVSDAQYYHVPIKMAADSLGLPLSKQYYWSGPLLLPNTSEEVMLCTVPLIDSKNNIYGVCGFDISTMLFKLTHMPTNNEYTRMFSMLSPLKASSVEIDSSIFAGGYILKDFYKENSELKIKESKGSFTQYISDNGTVYLGYHKLLQLYPSGSPYHNESWITAVLVPKEDIVDSITRLNIILSCLLFLLVTIGIIISIVFSNKYLKPISQGIEIIKSVGTEELPKTNVQEIDDLIHYLALYKKELNQKVEKEKKQLSMLEQFVDKTKTLTPAERSVFNLYIKGLSPMEIAKEMYLSINTIKTHNKRIFAKLGVASREELLLYITMLKEIGYEFK